MNENLSSSDNRSDPANAEDLLLGAVLHTIRDVAEVTGIDEKHINRWIDTGNLTCEHGIRDSRRLRLLDYWTVFQYLRSHPRISTEIIGPREVALVDLVRRPECSVRTKLSPDVVAEYQEQYAGDGSGMGPITVVVVESEHWLVDGWHRVAAAQAEENQTILAYVFGGNAAIAVDFARRANLQRGLKLAGSEKAKILRDFVADHPPVKEALLREAKSLRALERIFGFSKSALGREAQRLKQVVLETTPEPKAPEKDLPGDEELLGILQRETSSLSLPIENASPAAIRQLAQIAHAALVLLGRHRGLPGPASLRYLRSLLA